MTWAGRESVRVPKFAENMEYKGAKACGKTAGKLVCVLPPGHEGPHDFRPKDDGGH